MDLLEYGILILAYCLVTVGGAYSIKFLLSRYEEELQHGGLPHAGMIIGVIERTLIFTFILLGEYTAITIIFAAKSIARFNELKERRMSEYYLIGTLLSITSAVFLGIITTHLLENI